MSRSLAPAVIALAVTFLSFTSYGEDYRRKSGVVWGADFDIQLTLYGEYPLSEIDEFEDFWMMTGGSTQLGYRLGNTEFGIKGHFVADELGGVGLWAMYRLPFTELLLVGGGMGIAWLDMNAGLRFALPRVELRLPLSPSWEFAWTIAELSYVNTSVIEAAGDNSWGDNPRELCLTTSMGVRSRANKIWERTTPPPMSSSILIRANHLLGLVGVTADERFDPQVVGLDEDAGDDRFPNGAFLAVELAAGYRIEMPPGYLDLSVPLQVFVTQSKVGIGLSALWRFKKLSWLGFGAAASYYPKQYILVELPRLEVTYRPIETMEIFIVPMGLLLLFEPTRDVWVEEGIESKMPYFGMNFGIGIGWAVPICK